MTRPTEHKSYGPGKFEGESCIARFAYNATMNGFADWVDDDTGLASIDDATIQRITGPFTLVDVEQFEADTKDEMCQECLTYLLTLSHVDITESTQGFVFATA